MRELLEKRVPQTIKDMDIDVNRWQVQYLFFARSGYTSAAKIYGREEGIQLIDLDQMMAVLDADGAESAVLEI